MILQASRNAGVPHWRREEQLSTALLAPVRSWLLDDGSLTQHLLNTGKQFSLERWHQCWEAPRPDERKLLQMPLKELAMVRQIVMRLDSNAVVYARSVFPISTLNGPLRRLRRLHNKSLGAFLFSRPDMRRSPFQIALLAGDAPYLPESLHQDTEAWARRSCFEVADKPMLVSEVFLKDFPSWQSATPLHRSRRGQVSATIGRFRS
ncbi:chorismate lyase [Congregibacter variabilis]|uniref:Probable chorismate pyruvate-lyase n=1 Tax=Congregibacter variabilis TaxID=3081200 RepID=A0ABZ0I055_9GAMM|nr:chorismate lyase [Congregibacter sp. IMCC43200]